MTIFETPIEWFILFTIIFACNILPKFDVDTPAFKRRVRLVLFPFSFKEANECVRENHRVKQQFQFDDCFYNGFVNLLIHYYNSFRCLYHLVNAQLRRLPYFYGPTT